MLQHLLRRLVFDVPILNEYAKMPLKVCLLFNFIVFVLFLFYNNKKLYEYINVTYTQSTQSVFKVLSFPSVI